MTSAFGRTEADTCRSFVLPSLAQSGWDDDQVKPEYQVRARQVLSSGNAERELPDGRVDYVLEITPGLPVAVVEAKREHRGASDGIQQAVRYAQQLDVPIAYATNGREILERDVAAGTERFVESFMTPAEAWSHYTAFHDLTDAAASLIRQPFNRNKRSARGDVVQPRWYQTVAIHRVLRAIAAGEHRILLLMATGTGKTFTAMQLVQKLRSYQEVAHPHRNYRVLYLADRTTLVDQPQNKDFSVAFGGDPLWRVAGGANRSREIYFATYQAMAGGGDETELYRDYPTDFFDLVIVDECHRGSASENSSWRAILEHFAPAVQVGLTATPKQDDTVDTYRYFGDPVFSYSLRQGIEDGYLAPYRVRRVLLSPDADGWQPDPGEQDLFGRDIPQGTYTTRDFERVLRLLKRTEVAARYLSRFLRKDPTARMIVFCVNQEHADEMRRQLGNLNSDLMARDPEWVVRIVGAEEEKKRLLENFQDPDSSSPVVATTSRLLSTGIDVQDLKYVVLFRPVGSPVEFKQIVGRGTRLYPDKGKTSFEIIDFVGATTHFVDPDFDGFPTRIIEESADDGGPDDGPDEADPTNDPGTDVVAEPDPGFTVCDPSDSPTPAPADTDPPDDDQPPAQKLTVADGEFYIVVEALQVPDTSSGRLVLTEYGEHVAGLVKQLAATPADLSERWSREPTRQQLIAALSGSGIEIEALLPTGEDEVDPLDVLLQLAWNQPVRTRAERARRAREAHFADLEMRTEIARTVFSTLLDRYAAYGVDEITSPEITHIAPLSELGSARSIDRELAADGGLAGVIEQAQRWVYADLEKTVS